MRRLDDVMRTREDSFETDLKALYEASKVHSFFDCLLVPLQSLANFRLEICCFAQVCESAKKPSGSLMARKLSGGVRNLEILQMDG